MFKIKLLILILSFCNFTKCNAQNELKQVSFMIYESKNEPLPGVTIRVKDLNEIIETQTNFYGYAELNLSNSNVDIELSFLGPYVKFRLIDGANVVKINLTKKIALFYIKDKRIKRIKLKTRGY